MEVSYTGSELVMMDAAKPDNKGHLQQDSISFFQQTGINIDNS